MIRECQTARGVGETITDKLRGMLRRMIHPRPRQTGRRVIHPGDPWGSWSAGYHPPVMPMPREEYVAMQRRYEAQKNSGRW